MPSRLELGWAHTGEYSLLMGPRAAFWKRRRPARVIFYGHGATGNGLITAKDQFEIKLLRLLRQHSLVVACDWGGDTMANATGTARVEAVRLKLAADPVLNVDVDQVGFVGLSMGFGTGTAYAKAYPDRVKYVAGLIPLMDINDILVNNRMGLGGTVTAAYPGGYNDATHGPTQNPKKTCPTLSQPMQVWTSTNDTYIPTEVQDAFLAAAPNVSRVSLGAVGHSTAVVTDAVAAAVNAWCLSHEV